jgi:hypothetical protein
MENALIELPIRRLRFAALFEWRRFPRATRDEMQRRWTFQTRWPRATIVRDLHLADGRRVAGGFSPPPTNTLYFDWSAARHLFVPGLHALACHELVHALGHHDEGVVMAICSGQGVPWDPQWFADVLRLEAGHRTSEIRALTLA